MRLPDGQLQNASHFIILQFPTFLIQAVGKDLNRYSTYIKVGVEDYIIGNVSKKVDKKLYQVEDQARFSEALIGRLRLVGSDWSFLVGSDKVSHLSKIYKIVSSIYCIRLGSNCGLGHYELIFRI